MELTKTHGVYMDSWYKIRLLVQTWTHGIDMDSLFRHGLMVYIILMVLAKTHGIDIDNTHGMDFNSWYYIHTP